MVPTTEQRSHAGSEPCATDQQGCGEIGQMSFKAHMDLDIQHLSSGNTPDLEMKWVEGEVAAALM